MSIIQSCVDLQPNNMDTFSTTDWNTVVMDLQRAANNLALFVLESMTPPVWLASFLRNVDVTQPPPGYQNLSSFSSEETLAMDDKPNPTAKRRPIKDKDKGAGKKKKSYAAAASGQSH